MKVDIRGGYTLNKNNFCKWRNKLYRDYAAELRSGTGLLFYLKNMKIIKHSIK